MKRTFLLLSAVVVGLAAAVGAQKKSPGVSTEMLSTPSPEDWLMYSRTYDAQRYSPLEFVNRRNVSQLHSHVIATTNLLRRPIRK